MKILNKILTVFVLAVVLTFGLTGPITTYAVVTSPTLVGSTSYSVLSGTSVTNTGATTISGNVGISPAGGAGYVESGTTTYGAGSSLHNADASAGTAQADNLSAFGALSAAPNVACDTTYAGVKDLVGLSLVPGIYCADTFELSGTLTLNDTGAPDGVWIFRSAATLITSAGVGAKVQFLTGEGLACNVWWKVVSSATLGVGTNFIGNILASTAITLQTNATLNGRAFAYTGGVTLDANTISGPTCTAAPVPTTTGSSRRDGYINVVKTVINDNGGTKTVADFPLFVNGSPVVSGVLNRYDASTIQTYDYTVTETNDSNYTRTFSGDCSAAGVVTLNPYENKFCFITNNDIGAPVVVPPVPPLIEVLKVPSPLALPNGPGLVKYTYTLKNIGTVPVSNVTMVGDTCSPIVLISGDIDNDAKLDVTETWIHTCSTNLTETHTNVVTATGWANGISATDIASATVVVGVPIVPPLIHVVKVPSVFALSAPGGAVTYTYTVTNPGTEPLSDVLIADDKCTGLPARVVGHSGDLNKNNLLESNETWTFTCKTNLTQTTTNTGMAQGSANGLMARDFAIATVVVAGVVPALPNTGIMPTGNNGYWDMVIPIGVLVIMFSLYLILKKRSK
jgi:hypothetical protein